MAVTDDSVIQTFLDMLDREHVDASSLDGQKMHVADTLCQLEMLIARDIYVDACSLELAKSSAFHGLTYEMLILRPDIATAVGAFAARFKKGFQGKNCFLLSLERDLSRLEQELPPEAIVLARYLGRGKVLTDSKKHTVTAQALGSVMWMQSQGLSVKATTPDSLVEGLLVKLLAYATVERWVEGGFPLLIGRPWLRHTKALHDWGNDAMWMHPPDSPMQPIRLEGDMDPVVHHSSLSVQSSPNLDQPTPPDGSDEDLLQWLQATTSMPCYVVTIQALPEDKPSFPAPQAEENSASHLEASMSATDDHASSVSLTEAVGLGEPITHHRKGKKSPLQEFVHVPPLPLKSPGPGATPIQEHSAVSEDLPFEELPPGWLQEKYGEFPIDQTPAHDISNLQEAAHSSSSAAPPTAFYFEMQGDLNLQPHHC
ncbi:hypothetical protein L7F22_050692 [Adiantum nelumboides]|nr:hypothetical protein [Adiantum nelumboides]